MTVKDRIDQLVLDWKADCAHASDKDIYQISIYRQYQLDKYIIEQAIYQIEKGLGAGHPLHKALNQ